MRKILLMLLLTTQAGTASAGLEKVTSNAETGLTVYADPASMSQSDNTVTMLSLYDFSKVQSEEGLEPYASVTFQIEYDCKTEQRRMLAFSHFSKNMGKGEEVFSYHDVGSWSPFELGSLSESLWKFACGKR